MFGMEAALGATSNKASHQTIVLCVWSYFYSLVVRRAAFIGQTGAVTNSVLSLFAPLQILTYKGCKRGEGEEASYPGGCIYTYVLRMAVYLNTRTHFHVLIHKHVHTSVSAIPHALGENTLITPHLHLAGRRL